MTVSSLLGKSIVPLAARVELANQIYSWHYNLPSYAWNVVRRMTGHSTYEPIESGQIHSVEYQLKLSIKDDDSLFVEEEQNLFVDEIREAELWCRIFEEADLDGRSNADIPTVWSIPHRALAKWVLDGLDVLNKFLETDDGPLGWASKSAVFAVCMRVMLSAKSILRHHEGVLMVDDSRDTDVRVIGDITLALRRFLTLGHEKKVHERLIFEIEGRPNSPLFRLG